MKEKKSTDSVADKSWVMTLFNKLFNRMIQTERVSGLQVASLLKAIRISPSKFLDILEKESTTKEYRTALDKESQLRFDKKVLESKNKEN